MSDWRRVERCGTCRFWECDANDRAASNYYGIPDRRSGVGTCQIAPPVPSPGRDSGFFPATHENRWCGAWEAYVLAKLEDISNRETNDDA